MHLPAVLALTLLELLLIFLIIAGLVALYLRRKRGSSGGAGATAGPAPAWIPTPLPYPPSPTSATPGAVAAAGVAQGTFTDTETFHRRLTRQTYRFFRYAHHYLLVPSDRPKEGIVLNFRVRAASPGDRPAIVGTSQTTGSTIVDETYAIVVTDSAGQAEIVVEIPHAESSGPNTLEIMVEEVDSSQTVVRRVFHPDVAIVPP